MVTTKTGMHVNQFPSGRWGFVGSVHPELSVVTRDGKKPSDKQLRDAKQVGPGLIGLKPRSWSTKAGAVRAAKKLGVPVANAARRQSKRRRGLTQRQLDKGR